MKHLLRTQLAVAMLCLLQVAFYTKVNAQVQTARPGVFINPNCNGFYEYLPQGYNSGNEKYPLILFLHGMGELGNGTDQLPNVLRNGLPTLIANGKFPVSFTVGGSTYKFIVISPQFAVWPKQPEIDAVIDYAVRNYRVNTSRIYLTGLSMGGGAALEYVGKNSSGAQKFAALTTACGAYETNVDEGNVVAAANLPFWATHNSGDGTVPVSVTNNNINIIDNLTFRPPNPLAKKTIFNAGGHDAWTQTYDPNFKEGGLNVYEWMLQFTRGADAALPVVLGEYKASLSGENTVTVNWTTLSELHNKYFVLEKSTDGSHFSIIDSIAASNLASGHAYSATDSKAIKGNNFYRLSQVDEDGKTTYFKVLNIIVQTAARNSFRVSPNPAQATVQLDWTNAETGTIQVMLSDMQGRVLRTWKFDKQNAIWQQSLDITTIPAGNYTIQLKGNTVTQVQRLVKQ